MSIEFGKNPEKEEIKDEAIGMLGIIGSYMDSGESGVVDYLKQNLNTEEEMDYLRGMAKDVGSSWMPTPVAYLNALTGLEGTYYGRRPSNYKETEQDRVDALGTFNIKAAPDLLDILLGFKTPEEEGLIPSTESPSKRPASFGTNEPIYDVKPYVHFKWIHGDEENLTKLTQDITDLKEGEIINISNREGIGVDYKTDTDLGQLHWTIGKENGEAYLALADSWDFGGGSVGPAGEILEMITANPVNFYGRYPLDRGSYVKNENRVFEDVVRYRPDLYQLYFGDY